MPYKILLERIRTDAAAHRHALKIIAAIFALALLFFYFVFVKEAIVIIAFVGLAAMSRIWQRVFPAPIGANFILLSTVLSGALYGSIAGIFVGLAANIISAILVQDEPDKMGASVFAISLVGYLAGVLPISASNIALYGLGLTVLYDAAIVAANILFGSISINTVIFVITHIVFNYFVFFNLAQEIMNLLA